MLFFKMKYKCSICNNQQSWYISPVEEKTKSGDYYNSLTKFEIICKQCGQRYLLSLNMSKKKRKK